MELEPLQLLTTILEQYSVSEPLRQGESKINASIDFSNQIAEQMNKHTKWLQFVGDEVIRKIATRPYFFNILDDMLHCDYLTNNTCCFVLGTDSPTDGRMKLFYIVDTLPDGKEVDSVNVYQLDSGLYALYTTEETITTLRDLILQNSQEIDSLKEMVESGGNSYTPDNPPPYPVTSVAGKAGAVTLTKSDVGLGNVNNTTDANKPISTATQNALNLKAPLANPTFTGTVTAPTVNVTGNMRLKGSGNYGNILNFGDGDYVHIAEPSDDTLEIKGTRVNLLGEVKINGRAPGFSKKSATVVVGTTTSGHTLADCDYLCTGTNDNIVIQNAINSLPLSNSIHVGRVHLLDGTYYCTDYIVPTNGIIISGCGSSTILKRMYNESQNAEHTYGLIYPGSRQTYTCIRDIVIDGNKTNYSHQGNNAIIGAGVAFNVGVKSCAGTAFGACRNVIACQVESCNIAACRTESIVAGYFSGNTYGFKICDTINGAYIYNTTIYDFYNCDMVNGCYSWSANTSIYCSNAVGNYIYNCKDVAIYQNSANYSMTVGNYITGCSKSIRINDANQVIIANVIRYAYGYGTDQYSINLTGSYSGNICIGNHLQGKGVTNSQTNATVVYNNVV